MLYTLARIAADLTRWVGPVADFLRRVVTSPGPGFELELHDILWRRISTLANWLSQLVVKYWRGGGAAGWQTAMS